LVNTVNITNQAMLGCAYTVLAVLVLLILVKTKWKGAEELTFKPAISSEK
jgi:MFS transporter, DHA1 family, multidrug resistance protein